MLRQKPVHWDDNFLMKAFTYLGNGWILIWLLLIWFLSTGRQQPVLIAFLAMIIVFLTVTPLKVCTNRMRPREVIKAQSRVEEKPDLNRHLSFPSGDAAIAFCVASVIMSFVTWPFACLLLAAGAGVALLRVTAMAHYPSDSLAGASVGSFAGWLAIQIEQRWLPMQPSRFNLSRGMAISGVIAIPVLFGLLKGTDDLLIFLKTYGLLVVFIVLAIRGLRGFRRRIRDESS